MHTNFLCGFQMAWLPIFGKRKPSCKVSNLQGIVIVKDLTLGRGVMAEICEEDE